MRATIILAAVAAAALPVPPLAAQALPRAATLAAGEVALHVVAHGDTTTPADRIVVKTTVTGKGATAAEADAATGAAVARVTSALVAAGVDRSAIVSTRPGAGRAAPLITLDAPGAAGKATPRPAPAVTASATLTVTLGNQAALDRATRALEAEGQSIGGKPAASLADPAPARRAATIAAIARARSEADDYAAALGMRVVRVVAVSNAAGLGDGIEEIADMVERFGNRADTSDKVVTRATASVDYVLAPR